MRQALIISQGSFMIFLTRPISAICLGIACLFVLSNFLPFIRRKMGKLEEMEVK
jgi:TctA family transporter